MKWNGTVSNSGSTRIARRFAPANATQSDSSQYLRANEAITDISNRLDVGADELVPEPTDADIDDIGCGIERITPNAAEELVAPTDLALPAHEVFKEE